FTTFAQNIDTRRKIEVTGTAEAEVTPDIIYFAISLKEYFKDNANKNRVEIETLEKQLQTAVLTAGIPKENFMINNISGYNYPLEKKKDPGFLARKQYRIKLTDLTKMNQIMSAVDPKGIEYTNIESYDYSGIEALKRELKVKSVQAAKAKATYMAEGINEKVGNALDIQEINNESYPQPIYRANVMMMKAEGASADSSMPDIDFKKIKLSYQTRAVFELK
ncbi:MAG TPA: SIMPL domain-containing protein, partial [Sphingobacteriaceae bacterium]|nr:SIMPL domain-containing protein [Sphingobacteriaceae bacterium]